MKKIRVIQNFKQKPGFHAMIMAEEKLITVKADKGGIFYRLKSPNDNVRAGEIIGNIIHPYEGNIISNIISPEDGIVFFGHNKPLVLQGSPLFKIIVD